MLKHTGPTHLSYGWPYKTKRLSKPDFTYSWHWADFVGIAAFNLPQLRQRLSFTQSQALCLFP